MRTFKLPKLYIVCTPAFLIPRPVLGTQLAHDKHYIVNIKLATLNGQLSWIQGHGVVAIQQEGTRRKNFWGFPT